MPRKIDPAVETILSTLGLKSNEVLWDCHGTMVMYHRALEKVAADLKITFSPPAILEANGVAKSVAICVTGKTAAGREEWSIGEASPANNKNSYPWAMAEKRAKDRVILKLIGLHGLIYSEEEMDRTGAAEAPKPETNNAALDSATLASDLIAELRKLRTANTLKDWGNAPDVQERINTLFPADKERVRADFAEKLKALNMAERVAA